MNLNQISHHLKTMNLTRAGPPPPRLWWHAGKPPDLPVKTRNNKTYVNKTEKSKEGSKRRKIMKERTSIRNITGIIISALLFALVLAPSSAIADTAAGTTIQNTATVSWTGGTNSDTADVVVQFLEVTPVLTYVTTAPATTVGEGTPMTISYTLTSAANGVDTYTLGSSIAANADFTGTPAVTVNGD